MNEWTGGKKTAVLPPRKQFPPGLGVGWDREAGTDSDVTRGGWEEGSGRLNRVEGLLGRETAHLPASVATAILAGVRQQGPGRGSTCSRFQEEQLAHHLCGGRKHPARPDVPGTQDLL